MKKIKAINGYTIYEATKNDTKKYNVEEGYFYIYFSSDIRDYGISNSDWDWEAGSIEEATEWATGSNYAIAKEIVEETTTAATFEEIEEVEAMLNSGLSVEEIEEVREGKEEKKMKTITMQNSKKYNGLHFTTSHTGKMSGMASISTAVICNERCRKNAQIEGSICSKCFAAAMAQRFPGMMNPLVQNQQILTSSILPVELLPVINVLYFRFEAFGDLNNEIQVINYFNICRKNPGVKFALWTKNPDYIAAAIKDGHEKPENLNIILSSLFINKESKQRYDFVDKIFTVYDAEYITANNIDINCGARNCFTCGLCYNKNDVRIINEKLK